MTLSRSASLALFGLCLALPAWAQTDTATGTTPAADMTEDQCGAQFMALDTDANGVLTEAEAPQVFARARIDGSAVADPGMARDLYLNNCMRSAYMRATPDEGAPLEGANSFTEEQARDRATAWGLMDVGAMTKDDRGIWRGQATQDGKPMSVAVDYKGNVVRTAP